VRAWVEAVDEMTGLEASAELHCRHSSVTDLSSRLPDSSAFDGIEEVVMTGVVLMEPQKCGSPTNDHPTPRFTESSAEHHHAGY
jgi:hypothetical protein